MTKDNDFTVRHPGGAPGPLSDGELSNVVVYLVDDDPAIGRLVQSVLGARNIRVIHCQSGKAFLETVVPEQRGCLLLDVELPALSGPDIQQMLAKHNIHLPVVFLTGVVDVDTSVAVMKRGAFDLIQKPFQKERLIEIVEQAIRLDGKLAEVRQRRTAAQARYDTLNERERQVLQLVVSGFANKQVARMLDLSEKTIEVHRSRAMLKMGADSLAELVRLSMDAGVEQKPPN